MNKTTARMVLIMIALIAGSGCTKTVMVPVSSCPVPPELTMPLLMVDTMSRQSSTQDKLHAIKMDYGTLRLNLEQCITILDGYRKPSR